MFFCKFWKLLKAFVFHSIKIRSSIYLLLFIRLTQRNQLPLIFILCGLKWVPWLNLKFVTWNLSEVFANTILIPQKNLVSPEWLKLNSYPLKICGYENVAKEKKKQPCLILNASLSFFKNHPTNCKGYTV